MRRVGQLFVGNIEFKDEPFGVNPVLHINSDSPFTISRPHSCDGSDADTYLALSRTQAQRRHRRPTPAGEDTRQRREHAPETVRVRVRCLPEFQAMFQPS